MRTGSFGGAIEAKRFVDGAIMLSNTRVAESGCAGEGDALTEGVGGFV